MGMAERRSRGEAASLGFWANTGAIHSMEREHAHADIELNFLYHGRVRYFFNGRFQEMPVGKLTAFWAAIPHRVVDSTAESLFGWVCVPLAQFLRYDLSQVATKRLLAGEFIVDPNEDPEDALRLRRWTADCERKDPYDIQSVALEVEARIRRLMRAGGTARHHVSLGASGRVEEIASWIGEHYREELTLATIGAAVGLHPNYAMSLFRSTCGMSVWRYVTRLRLAHAQRLLATTERTALAIAMDSGFGSLNRFYEAFRKEFAMPPGEFRKRNRT
jgi:AraC-like DNA-binding protein